jgi:hypothetical protein
MADRLAGLIEELGWATLLSNGKSTKEMDSKEEVESSQIKGKGITMLSHSKYILFSHQWTIFIFKTNLPQRFLYAHLDVKRTSRYRCSVLLCRSSYFLFMGGGSVFHSLATMLLCLINSFFLIRRVLQLFLPSASDSKFFATN